MWKLHLLANFNLGKGCESLIQNVNSRPFTISQQWSTRDRLRQNPAALAASCLSIKHGSKFTSKPCFHGPSWLDLKLATEGRGLCFRLGIQTHTMHMRLEPSGVWILPIQQIAFLEIMLIWYREHAFAVLQHVVLPNCQVGYRPPHKPAIEGRWICPQHFSPLELKLGVAELVVN